LKIQFDCKKIQSLLDFTPIIILAIYILKNCTPDNQSYHIFEKIKDNKGVKISVNKEFSHISVLSKELLAELNIKKEGFYLDATAGGGGHSELILANFPKVKIWAIDRDEMAIAAASQRLFQYSDRLQFWQGNFADYQPRSLQFDGIIADLGVSSPQLDLPERGFSFQNTANLDMRMDRKQSLTAEEIINHWSEIDLAKIFYEYGEERYSRRIARQIVQKRPLHTTTQLAETISLSVPPQYRYGRINPATRVFQALRIAVNQELSSLEKFISQAPTWLKPEGLIAIISFHSLEDRIVKHSFKDSTLLEVLTKKPIIAQPEEQKQNPRSRSAKLRIARKRD
jgi:16S rRNA (cytosine1402-N4)-methyltransferase